MATNINVAILGLGRIGASLGLALKRYNAGKDARQQFIITGFDSDSTTADTAKRKNAVDSLSRSPIDAAANKDIVIIALPYGEVQGAYRAIASSLRAGTVILDTAPLKLPSMEWAEKYLSTENHLIGITPVLNSKYLYDGVDDIEHAAVDLFDKGSFLLMPGVKSVPDAVELASGLAELVGATPHFVDAAEHDGWIAATEGLPALLGLAVFQTLRENPNWDDAQRAGNPSLGRLTHHLFDTHPDDIRDLLLQDRENIGWQVDQLINTLTSLRNVLAENDRAALEDVLSESSTSYSDWLNRRQNARWSQEDGTKTPQTRDMLMGGVLGGFLSKRLKGGKDAE